MCEPVQHVYSNAVTLSLQEQGAGSFLKTYSFTPIPNVNISMRFEYRHGIIFTSNSRIEKIFSLKLVKLSALDFSTRFLMNVHVSVINQYNRNIFRSAIKNVNVLTMNKLNFDDFVIEEYFSNQIQSVNALQTFIKYDTYLTLKCKMTFLNVSIRSSATDQTTTKLSTTCVCSVNNLQHFIKDYSLLFESGDLSDVKFFVNNKTLAAHKSILAAHSPVFSKMLNGNFKESQTSIINISDSTYGAFKKFLKFLYTAEVSDQSWMSVKELYVLADKYDVSTLKRECRKIIPTLLNTDIISEILILAFHYDDAELKKVSTEYAFVHIKTLSASQQWKTFVKSYPHIGYEVLENFMHEQCREQIDLQVQTVIRGTNKRKR